jgi:hypothetical protein
LFIRRLCWAEWRGIKREGKGDLAKLSFKAAFLNLRKVIIRISYLPLSQLDSQRGFWQEILASEGSKAPNTSRRFVADFSLHGSFTPLADDYDWTPPLSDPLCHVFPINSLRLLFLVLKPR